MNLVLPTILLFIPAIFSAGLPGEAIVSNLFLTGDFNCSLIQVRGRASVGGNVNINTVQIGCQTYSTNGSCDSFGSVTCSQHPRADPVLRAGGYLNATSSQVFGGNVVYGTTLISSPAVVSDCAVSQQSSGNLYTETYNSLVSYRTELTNTYASRGSSGNIVNGGDLQFTGTGQSVEVFQINYQTPSRIYSLTLQNVNPSSTVIIFVQGEAFTFSNIGLNGQFSQLASQIIWVFPSVSVNIFGTTFYGTILAPNAALRSSGAQFNGQIFAQSYTPSSGTECSQVNLVQFNGQTPTGTSTSQAASTTQTAPTSSQAAPTTSQATPTTSQAAPTTSQAAPTTSQGTPATSSSSSGSCQVQNDCAGYSEDYNFVSCVSGRCQCNAGFSGSATASDMCRCNGNVVYNNGVPTCLQPGQCTAGRTDLCSGYTTNYNFIECDNGQCKCKAGFSGSATPSDKCRCDGTVTYNGNTPTCA